MPNQVFELSVKLDHLTLSNSLETFGLNIDVQEWNSGKEHHPAEKSYFLSNNIIEVCGTNNIANAFCMFLRLHSFGQETKGQLFLVLI